MLPVADDFAAIATRLKEIQAEVAKERAAAEASDDDSDQPEANHMYDDLAACA